ncbi:MAG: hypothetical protein C5B43_00315 [Verrucomicrobia bacterium]|nr:MAG: hypothetical protein C5B43_00315 [Verrucomicrobiota bacterium]
MEIDKNNVFGATDRGIVRENNEDAFLINLGHQLFAVADGLGGLPSGDLASQLAIDALNEMVLKNTGKDPIDFTSTFKTINKAVNEAGLDINSDFGIGTTLSAIQFQNNKLFGGHVGDSGVFLFTKEDWSKLTKDHTMAEDIRDTVGSLQDQITIPDYYNNILTQCLGKNDSLQVQVFEYAVTQGERFLLYTDGVTKAFSPSELHKLVWQFQDPKEFIEAIITEANARGGVDNIAAIAIFV